MTRIGNFSVDLSHFGQEVKVYSGKICGNLENQKIPCNIYVGEVSILFFPVDTIKVFIAFLIFMFYVSNNDDS